MNEQERLDRNWQNLLGVLRELHNVRIISFFKIYAPTEAEAGEIRNLLRAVNLESAIKCEWSDFNHKWYVYISTMRVPAKI